MSNVQNDSSETEILLVQCILNEVLSDIQRLQFILFCLLETGFLHFRHLSLVLLANI